MLPFSPLKPSATRGTQSSWYSWDAGHSWDSRIRIRLLEKKLGQILLVLRRTMSHFELNVILRFFDQIYYFHFWRFLVDSSFRDY